MLVYILFHETNVGHSDDSDGYVEAVYATEEAADAAMLAAIREAVADGQDVYWNPDTQEEGPADWTDDWRIVVMEVQERFAPVNTSISAWDRASASGRHVFYEPETETIRQCPENYCLMVRRDGQWIIDIDAASPINAHSLRLLVGARIVFDPQVLADAIETGFWGELGGSK